MPTPDQIVETHNLYLFRQKKIDDLLGSFDPNKNIETVWGVYAPSRSGPKFRLFYRTVDAVNSVKNNQSQSGAVYYFRGGEWKLYEVWVDGKELYR